MSQADLQQAAERLRSCFSELNRRSADIPSDADAVRADLVAALDLVLSKLSDTERREALALSFIDIAGVILLAIDHDGRIATINREGAEFLGYTERELVGQDWFECCIPPDCRTRVRRVFTRLMRGETANVVAYENPVLCRSGTQRLVQWHNNVWRDSNSQVIGTISSGRDVTDHRRAEDSAVDSAARLLAVVNTAVDAIITIDDRGTIESVNPATELMFGYSTHELVGRNVSVLMPSPYRQEHDGYLRRYLETGEKHIIGIGREVRGRRKAGSTCPIDLAVSEFHIGGRRMFTGMIRDISDRKELERQVLDIATEEQQRIGRDLHDSLGQELTGIAFLTGVLHRTLAQAKHPNARDAAEVVKLVNQAIDHTRALVRGLCPVDLEADGLMIALQQLCERVKDLHGIRCEMECPRPVMIRDHNVAKHLYFIANEAVTNAGRHGMPRRFRIALTASAGRVRLAIHYDGGWLPSDRIPGRGRGLHIMNYRARMIGGALEIESNGKGTCVTCSFTHSE